MTDGKSQTRSASYVADVRWLIDELVDKAERFGALQCAFGGGARYSRHGESAVPAVRYSEVEAARNEVSAATQRLLKEVGADE